MKIFFLIIFGFLVITSCSKKHDETKDTHKPSTEQNVMQAPSEGSVTINGNIVKMADFQLELPSSWSNETPSSTMRISEFSVKNNPNLKIVGFYFGNMDNMVEANIERWKGEFVKVDNVENLKAANNIIDIVKINGTFKKKPFPMAQEFEEAENYSTLACIIPSNQGPYFFKVVGPKSEIDKEKQTFIGFLNTYKKN